MANNNWDKVVQCYCRNCGHLHQGYRGKNGLAILKCPICGVISISSKKGRRREHVDFIPPDGQEIIN